MYKIYTIDFVVPLRQTLKLLRIMRWTILLILAGLLQVSATTLGQHITLKKQNASLESILKEIHRQSGFDMVYDLDVVNKTRAVTINIKNATVQEALSATLSGLQLNFQIDNRKVVIKEKTFLDKVTDVIPSAMDIRCIVTDSLGNTLPGAVATSKLNKTSYLADAKGEFIIPNITDAGVLLTVSYVGYESKDVYVNTRSVNPYKIVLKAAMNRLNEINVVYDGYSKISKERAAGAYAAISRDDIISTPSANLLERLAGKLPGVNFDIKNNNIQVRGVNDYSTTGTPLIVVDGFPLISTDDQPQITTRVGSVSGNAIVNRFNPDDIEQITVLKDASATSIWGSRGANGVIVIETRKGKRGMPTINANYTFGVSQRPDLNKLSWMNSSQYIDMEKDLVDRGLISDPTLALPGNAIYTYNNSDATEWMFRVKRGTATEAQRDAALAELSTHSSLDQINKYLLQNNVTQQANLSVSGGAENTTYSVSGNYTRNAPFFKSNLSESYYLNSNLTSGILNKRITFRTGLNVQFDNSKNNGAAVDALSSTYTSLRPYDLLVDANGNPINRTIIFRQSIGDNLVSQGYLPFGYNAYNELNYSNSAIKTNTIRLTAGLNGKITNWLNADVSFMSQQRLGNTNTINELNSYANRLQLNTATSVSGNKLIYGIPYGGTYIESNYSGYDNAYRGQLNFNHTFNSDHQITALVGSEIRETYSKSTQSTRYGFNTDANTIGQFNPSNSYMTLFGYSSFLPNNLSGINETKRRYLSYYGNAAYSYKEKYVLTGSLRFDDATLIGIDRSVRARPFWSAGARWNASKEKFMYGIDWLSDWAMRVSYGTSGTVPTIGSNVTVLGVTPNADNRTGLTTAVIESPANSTLRWSTTRQLNIGTDFNLFKGRLVGSLDYYTKKTTDIPRNLPFNPTYGWSSLPYNTASMKGHGVDVGITGEIIKLKRFHWSSTLNFSYTTNKVTDERFNSPANTLVSGSASVVGYPISSLFLYRWAGLDNQGQSQIYDRNGNIISSNTNIINTFTRDDLRSAGVTYPPYTGGFFNTFTVGPFTSTVQFTYYFGNVFLRPSVTTNNYPTSGSSTFYGSVGKVQDLAYRWRQPGDEATTNIPGITYSSFNSISRYQYSDALLEKGDHIRLQQVSLNYVVPVKYLPKYVIKSLSVGANVQNLGIVWRANKHHLDPLYVNTGTYTGLSPAPSYLLQLNASF